MNPGKVEWNEENKPQPDMELLEQWISRQEYQMREDIAALIRIPSIADQQEAKVQAVLDDHAAGGHTDVGAVDVVEDDRLKILVNDLLALFQSVGCRDHAVFGLCPLVGAGIPCLHNISPLSLCLPQHS